MKVPQATRRTRVPSNTRAAFQRLARKVLLYVGTAVLLFVFLGYPYRQSGNAMFPGVRDGDLVLVCRPGKPCHDQVVAYEDSDGGTRLGRVVAVGGQTVEFLEGGGYLVDGYAPTEANPYETAGTGTFTVGPGEVFVLNDLRTDASDSRAFGPVAEEDICGHVVLVVRRRGF